MKEGHKNRGGCTQIITLAQNEKQSTEWVTGKQQDDPAHKTRSNGDETGSQIFRLVAFANIQIRFLSGEGSEG